MCCCPSLINRLSPGTTVNVWFDAQPNTPATFLGRTGITAIFLIGAQVGYIPCDRIQTVAISKVESILRMLM